MVSDRAFIFHVHIPWGKALSLVPKSMSSHLLRSNVKVTVFEKKKKKKKKRKKKKKKKKKRRKKKKKTGRCGGILVSQTHLVHKKY